MTNGAKVDFEIKRAELIAELVRCVIYKGVPVNVIEIALKFIHDNDNKDPDIKNTETYLKEMAAVYNSLRLDLALNVKRPTVKR